MNIDSNGYEEEGVVSRLMRMFGVKRKEAENMLSLTKDRHEKIRELQETQRVCMGNLERLILGGEKFVPVVEKK